MSDLIKREDAIKAVAQDLMYESCIQSEYASDELSDWIEVAKVMLEEVPSADSPQEWIPCSERLPDDNREVLISLEWGIDIGTYERGEWRSEWINHYDDDNVLAWMPLPKPWKGADDESD